MKYIIIFIKEKTNQRFLGKYKGKFYPMTIEECLKYDNLKDAKKIVNELNIAEVSRICIYKGVK